MEVMMKKLFCAAAVVLGLFVAQRVEAQVNVNINVGLQPSWGPSGYNYARYYYLPEMDIYYDVGNRHYTYYDGRRWISHRNLPKRYRQVNLHRTHKVVINESRPWQNHKIYHKKYRRPAVHQSIDDTRRKPKNSIKRFINNIKRPKKPELNTQRRCISITVKDVGKKAAMITVAIRRM